MMFSSLHLPRAPEQAMTAVGFAAGLGVGIVIFKAGSREDYLKMAKPLLDMAERFSLTTVLQNHAGSPISTIDDFLRILDKINDPRAKVLFEVGHFHRVGVGWSQACDALRDRIALVHLRDVAGDTTVPFGTGEIDLPGLIQHLEETGYDGDYVLEFEGVDERRVLNYLERATRFLNSYLESS